MDQETASMDKETGGRVDFPRRSRRRPGKTASQRTVERSVAGRPGWKVLRRTMSTAGTLKLACRVGELAVDVSVGRGGRQTISLRDPADLLDARIIGSLIETRNEVVTGG